jgi:hypothetical protein
MNDMDFPTRTKFQLMQPKYQVEQDGTGRCASEVRTLCNIVFRKHDDFNSGTKVQLGKGFKPLYQVFKLLPVGRFCFVEFLPWSRLPFNCPIQKYYATKALSTSISKTVTHLELVF